MKPEVRLVHKMSSLEHLSLISLDLDLRLLVVNASKDTWATSFSALRILHLPSWKSEDLALSNVNYMLGRIASSCHGEDRASGQLGMSSGPAALPAAVLSGLLVSPGAQLWASAYHHCLLGIILWLDCFWFSAPPSLPRRPIPGSFGPRESSDPYTAPTLPPCSPLQSWGLAPPSAAACSVGKCPPAPPPGIEVSTVLPHLRFDAFCSHPSTMGKVSTETVAEVLIEIACPALIKW